VCCSPHLVADYSSLLSVPISLCLCQFVNSATDFCLYSNPSPGIISDVSTIDTPCH
jgi:hypothetical protein